MHCQQRLTLTARQAVQRAKRCTEKQQDELLFTRNSSLQVLTCELRVDSCHYLNLGNFLSDHRLLLSGGFHDVLCRHGNRMNWGRVLHRQTLVTCRHPSQTRRRVRRVFSSTVRIHFSTRFGNCKSFVRSSSCDASPKLLGTNEMRGQKKTTQL